MIFIKLPTAKCGSTTTHQSMVQEGFQLCGTN